MQRQANRALAAKNADLTESLRREAKANAELAAANAPRRAAVRAGGRGDQDVPHRRQRGLPAQAGPVQGPARPAAEVGRRTSTASSAPCWAGRRTSASRRALAQSELRAGRPDRPGRPLRRTPWRLIGRCWRRGRRWRPSRGLAPLAKVDVGRSLIAVAGPARSDGQDGRGSGGLPAGGVAAGGPGGCRSVGAGRAGGLPDANGLDSY